MEGSGARLHYVDVVENVVHVILSYPGGPCPMAQVSRRSDRVRVKRS